MQEKKSNKKKIEETDTSPVVNVEQPLKTWNDCFMKFVADLSGNVTPKRDIN